MANHDENMPFWRERSHQALPFADSAIVPIDSNPVVIAVTPRLREGNYVIETITPREAVVTSITAGSRLSSREQLLLNSRR